MGIFYDEDQVYLHRTLSQLKDAIIEKEPPPPPKSTKPNGGSRAWLQVAGAFFLYLNTWGECDDIS